MLFPSGNEPPALFHPIKCVCTYAATGSLNFPSCCMRYMRSPPFTYSITKYSRSCKTRHISVHMHRRIRSSPPNNQSPLYSQNLPSKGYAFKFNTFLHWMFLELLCALAKQLCIVHLSLNEFSFT